MNVLSLDVSMRNIGACLFVDGKPVKLFYLDNSHVTGKTTADVVAACFFNAMEFFHDLPKNNLDAIVVESPTGSQSFNSALNFSFEACFKAYIQRMGYWTYKIAPAKGKLVTGDKNATKRDVIKWCLDNYPDLNYVRSKQGRVINKAEHECDALVNGLAFIQSKDY